MQTVSYNQAYNAYYYHYLNCIYQLINNYHWSYLWIDLNHSDYLYKNCSGKRYKEFFTQNSYLNDCKNNKKQLGLDILKNGMYFPFFGLSLEQKELSKHQINLLLGKHRLYSLLNNKELLENKKFLFLIAPFSPSEMFNSKILINEEIYIAQKNNLYTFTAKNRNQFVRAFIMFSDTIPEWIYPYGELIKPNPILNDEELFKQFIESPLDENNIMFKYYKELKEAE